MADAAPTSAATTPQQTASVAELQNARVDLRRVSVQRNGRSLGTYDAVELFARGEGGPQLQAGDTIVLVNKAILVRVSGEVAHPGTAFLSADEPLSDAVSQAGGLLSTATVARMTLTRGGTAHPLAEGDAAWTQPAHAGDAIMVPVAPRVSVAGIVQHPGEFTLRADTTLLSALYQAGGPAKFADVAHVAVVRDGQKTQYNVTRLVKGDLTQNPVLRDGDVVLVPQGRGIDGQAVFQNILSAALLLRPF
jgi:protein involved in polysaccharide export with SLBB domain